MDDDISVHSVLGLLTLLAICVEIDVKRGIFAFSELQHTFFLQLYQPGNELPDDVSLDESKPIIPPGVRSNISSATSSL